MSIEGARVAYLYGGRGKHGPLDDLHMLDLEGNLWSQPKVSGERPAGRYGHSAEPHENKVYLFGGRSKGALTFAFGEEEKKHAMFTDKKKGKRESDTEVTDEVIEFNTELLEFNEVATRGDTPPCARYKHGACIVPKDVKHQVKVI